MTCNTSAVTPLVLGLQVQLLIPTQISVPVFNSPQKLMMQAGAPGDAMERL